MKLRLLPAFAGAAVLALGLAGCSGSADANTDAASDSNTAAAGYAVDADTLVFGVVPDSVDTETNYQPLMDYIQATTGKTVEYHESTDYAALIEAAIAGQIDVASFSGFTYVTALNNGAKITPIASIIEEDGQEPGYYAMAIAPADSDVESIADFAGKKVCFVDPSSTSGYLFPSYTLLEAGIDPEKDVTAVFAGKHDVSLSKTAAGVECEVGFAEGAVVKGADEVKIIDQMMVPGAPIVVSDALPEDVRETLSDSLVDMTIDDMTAAGIDSAENEGFRNVFFGTKKVDDAYYDLIRDVCAETNATQCQG